jgi:uncharacterized HhH-GPD family protein
MGLPTLAIMPTKSSSVPVMPVTSNDAANDLLVTDPLALLLGMLLDQQVPMEWAFLGPWTLRERMGGTLDAGAIASTDPDELEALFRGPPALHRFPASMAKRTQAVCAYLVEHHGGDAADLWTGAADGADLLKRLRGVPGYGSEKARIFIAILGKRFGIRPAGWEEAAAPFSDEVPRSVADIDSPEGFERVRAFKKARRAEGKGKAD